MAEHYTRNTVWVMSWCPKCRKSTQHRVDGVRKGPCMECMERLEAEAKQRAAIEPAPKQTSLF